MKIPGYREMSITDDIFLVEVDRFIYIPLISGLDDNITVYVKPGDYIYMGDIIGMRKGFFKIPILSSVSGKLIKFEEMTYLNNTKVKCVVIENDFKDLYKETRKVKKSILDFSKAEFTERLYNSGVVGLGGGAFPAHIKYETEEHIKTLIVNAVECEPYLTTDYMLAKTKTEEILEAVNAILSINDIEEAIIVVKNDNYELLNILNSYVGTYPLIKIVPVKNYYPAGYERNIIADVLFKKYDKLPIEASCIVSNIGTVYAIYEALKYDKPLIERVVTITGSVVNGPINVKVRIGTPIKSVLKNIGGIKESDSIMIIAGGALMGTSVIDDELVISNNLSGVILLESTSESVIGCLRCGLCTANCPSKLAPVLIKDNIRNDKRLSKLRAEDCIECGLCSFVCPSKILIREIVMLAKDKVKEEK